MDGAYRLGEPVTAGGAAGNAKRIEGAARCFDASGRLTRWPGRRAEQLLVLWVLWDRIPTDTRYSEAEINAMLRDWNLYEDHVLLRRELCDLGLLRRTPDGHIYRRVAHDMPADGAALVTRLG